MAKSRTAANALDWLLEPEDVGARYLALRDLAATTPKALKAAKLEAHTQGPIAKVLAKMNKDGYWDKPGPGYNRKYRSTVWSLVLLAQLGADMEMDERIGAACSYLLDHALAPGGQFSINGAPGGT